MTLIKSFVPHSRCFGSYFDVIFLMYLVSSGFSFKPTSSSSSSSSTQFSQEWARRKVVVKHSIKSNQNQAMPIYSMFRNEKNLINLMLFNEIDNFIEVYNNSVIELVQCFGTSFFGRIDHLASSVIKFRPKNSVPKHCIRSITYNYCASKMTLFPEPIR